MLSAADFPLLIKNLLLSPMAVTPDQTIHYGFETCYSYAEFHTQLGKAARGFQDFGIGAGSTIAVMDWDSHRYFECFFWVPMVGATLHTINIRLSPRQIAFTINHARDDVILVSPDFAPVLEEIWDQIEHKPKVFLLGEGQGPETTLPISAAYDNLSESSPAGFDFPDLDENTRATLFYTTGTTGDPKAVSYSHRQLVLHTLAVAAHIGGVPGVRGLHRADVYMPITPLFHVHAWGFPYVATMLGIKQIYPGKYDPETLLRLIAHHDVTFSHCVPTVLSMLLDHSECAPTDLSRWKVLIGGAALSAGLAQKALDLGIDIVAAYGMSETCPFLTTADLTQIALTDGDALDVRTATGKPIPLVDLKVVDPDMRNVAQGDAGEIVARAPWLTYGYEGDPEKSETLWVGGYLHTGDVGYVNNQGAIRITDRIKDVIKSGGEWISSLEIENIVSQVEGVSEVAAIGVGDEKWGERPYLWIVAQDGPKINDAVYAAIDHAIENGVISKWARPDGIKNVAEIPKTSVGKIDKKRMRGQMAQK